MKAFIIRLLSILFFTSFCTMLFWHYFTYSHPHTSSNAGLRGPRNAQEMPDSVADVAPQNAPNSNAVPSSPNKIKKNPANNHKAVPSSRRIVKKKRAKSKENEIIDSLLANYTSKWKKQEKNIKAYRENEIIDRMLANYTSKWKKQEKNIKAYRAFLSKRCNAISNATVTQENSPVGTKLTYDGDKKKSMQVTPALFKLFHKDNPFKNAPWDTCAVVGNGGILANTSCGKQIDSATFVIRCNLPPLSNGHEKDTGIKTSLVTANPSILVEKYRALNEHRRSFVEDMQLYGDALLFLPAFSFRRNMAVSLRALYSLEDISNGSPRPVFFNPIYLNSLSDFWRDQGIHSLRLSSGIMMVSLALELCNNVDLYGFWPFGTHPYTLQQLNNHYYDNRPVNKRMHAMPAEFEALLNLHNKGVIHLHLRECTN